MNDIIQTFAAYRLLTLDHDPATRAATVELAHEAIIREWGRLRGWLDESRADVRMQRLLGNATTEWHNAGRDTGFLLSGSRLAQFEGWAAGTGLALTRDERAYLQASLAERERQAVLEGKRQAREAGLERRSRNFLRALVVVLLLATVGAFGLTGVAVRNEAEARSLALASAAQLALNEGNIDLAIQQAEAALQIGDNALARRILEQAAFAPGSPRIFSDLAGGFAPRVLAPQETNLTFAIVSHSGSDVPFWLPAIKGMEDACTLLEASCYWLSEPVFGIEEMAGHWEDALALNPDGIGTTVFDPEVIRSGVERAAEQGIPVVVLNAADPYAGTDQALPTLLYIGDDGFLSSRSNARRVFAEAEADGMTIQRGVCTIQEPGVSHLEARCAGIASVFDEQGVPIDRLRVGSTPSVARDEIADYFADHPDTNAIFMGGPRPVSGLNLYMQQAGLQPRQLYATTHDTSEEIFQMIRDGYLLQTIDQKPYMQGFQTIMSLYLYRQYALRPGGFINTGSVVDQSNVDLVAQLVELGYR
jgi:simple sugar transport system substrate-binding protein